MEDEGARERFEVPRGYCLSTSITMHSLGAGDPTARVARDAGFELHKAGRTPAGPATVSIAQRAPSEAVIARVWGPGAAWVRERVPAWLGALDAPERFVAGGPVGEAMRRVPGLRLGRSPFASDIHLAFVLQQRVTTEDAKRSFRALCLRYGERAPGPLELTLFPDHKTLARLPSHAFFEAGVETKRAGALREAARLADRIHARSERLDELRAYLMKIPGTGVWTAENLLGFGFGDPDAVPLGDVHLPHIVGAVLADEPYANDARMLELLAPYAGQRFRVLRLVMLARTGRIPR